MGQDYQRELVVPTVADTDGASINVKNVKDGTIHFGFSAGVQWVAEYTVEGRIGNLNFTTIQASITTSGFVDIPKTVDEIRVHCVAFTSGTPRAILCGENRRSY